MYGTRYIDLHVHINLEYYQLNHQLKCCMSLIINGLSSLTST